MKFEMIDLLTFPLQYITFVHCLLLSISTFSVFWS